MVSEAEPGEVFVPGDFAEAGSADAVRKALSRMGRLPSFYSHHDLAGGLAAFLKIDVGGVRVLVDVLVPQRKHRLVLFHLG